MEATTQKQQITRIFDDVAARYDCPALRLFPICADRLLAHLQPRSGEKLLDVATGTGALAVSAAQMVIPGGRVTGIDLSEGMLARAEATAKYLSSGNIDWHTMDGEHLEFRNDYFHMVSCSFGLFFMPDMARALREWRRVARPGGRIGFSSFGPEVFAGLHERLRADAAEAGAELPPNIAERLMQSDICRELMTQAGLVDVQVHSESLGYHLAGAQDWWEVVNNSALRGLVERVPAAARADFEARHLAAIAALADADGIWLNVPVHFTCGRKAG